MKTHLQNGIVTFSLLGLLSTASAQVILSDDFESGLGNWTQSPASPGLTLSTAQNHTPGGTQSAQTTTSSSRMIHNLGGEYLSSVRMSYYLFDDTGTRTYGEMRSHSGETFGSGSLQQLFAIGKYHASFGTPTGVFAGETVDTGLYQGRILTGPDSGWFNLPGIARTPGEWVKFDLERLEDGTVNFYVNDTLSRSIDSATLFPIESLMLGSVAAGTTPTSGFFDDYQFAVVPEPSTWALLALGAAGLLMAKRRRA